MFSGGEKKCVQFPAHLKITRCVENLQKNRILRVKFTGHLSGEEIVKKALCLHPDLFLIFINDLAH